MSTIRLNTAVAILSAVIFSLLITDAMAGGFFVRQQSTSAQASAFAGASARGSDPSHLFYNPATIVDNPDNNLTIDFRGFFPTADISASQATNLLGQNVIGRGPSGEMTDPALAPGLFVSSALSENVFVGVGVSAPFAVIIESRPSWAGQFQLVKTDMTTMNVNPVMAWKIFPGVTISGGMQVQKFETDVRKTEILQIATPPFTTETLGFLKGEDTGIGATAGLLLESGNGARLGIGYRSAVKHEMKGTAGVKSPIVPVDTAFFDITLPQVVTIGGELPLGDRITLLGETQWIDWSVFEGFIIDFGSGRPTEVRGQDWRDTWFVSGGVRVKVSDSTDVSAGVSYDQGISKGAGGNTLSPDGDRTGVSLGLTRQISETTTASLSYMHLFIDDSPINVQNQSGTLTANFASDLDIVGFSLTFRR